MKKKKADITPTESEVVSALKEINPFWSNSAWAVPTTHRYPFYSAINYLEELGSQRAIFLRGFRGVGKSTILRQIGNWLLQEKAINAKNIVYVDFEKRPLRNISWKQWFSIWEKELKPSEGLIYFLLDEIQYTDDWVEEVRSLLIDSRYRIVVTGSAASEIQSALDQEVRRWISIHVPSLLFYEYCLIFHSTQNSFFENDILKGRLFFEKNDFNDLPVENLYEKTKELFRNYILRGGFPESAKANLSLSEVQSLLADVVDKALYQDMRTQFSRQDIQNLEHLLEYVCRNPGLLIDKTKVSENLNIIRQTVTRYIKALCDGDFIQSLENQNREGKKSLKAKPKLYPSDASLRNAILGRTDDVLTQSEEMGQIIEGMIANHLNAYAQTVGGTVGFWRKKDNEEIDFIYQKNDGTYWIIESKYGQLNQKWLKALKAWPKDKLSRVSACFLVNRDKTSNTPQEFPGDLSLNCHFKSIPASVFLYILSREMWLKGILKESLQKPNTSTTGSAKGIVEFLQNPNKTGNNNLNNTN